MKVNSSLLYKNILRNCLRGTVCLWFQRHPAITTSLKNALYIEVYLFPNVGWK